MRSKSLIASAVVLAAACNDPSTSAPPCTPISQIITKNSDALLAGRSTPLIADLYKNGPYGPERTDDSVVWKSSNVQVLSVSGHTAHADHVGTATLTAEACGRSLQSDVTVMSAGYVVTYIADAARETRGYALNNLGQVLASSGPGSPAPHDKDFLWNGGSLTDLGSCRGRDINNRSQILCVGAGPTIWENGSATAGDTLTSVFASVINDSGHVAGASWLWTGPGTFSRLYPNDASSMSVSGINVQDNISGTVTGGASHGYGQATLWRNGESIGFAAVGGRYSIANALNDSGDVVGYGETSPSNPSQIAIVWRADHQWGPEYPRPSTGGVFNDVAKWATDINNQRDVIGSGSQGPWIWSSSRLKLLNQLLADPDWTLSDIVKINDKGQILALGKNTRLGLTGAVLLDPP